MTNFCSRNGNATAEDQQLQQDDEDGERTALSKSCITDENICRDLSDQETWVHILRPRSAMLKFRMPFEGYSNYSYLKGKMYLQTFGSKSSTEVSLCVDAPSYPMTK